MLTMLAHTHACTAHSHTHPWGNPPCSSPALSTKRVSLHRNLVGPTVDQQQTGGPDPGALLCGQAGKCTLWHFQQKELRPLDGRQARANTGTPSRRGDQDPQTPPRPGCWVMTCLRDVLSRLLPNPGLSRLLTSNTTCYTVFGCGMFSTTPSCNPAVCTNRVLLPILD